MLRLTSFSRRSRWFRRRWPRSATAVHGRYEPQTDSSDRFEQLRGCRCL